MEPKYCMQCAEATAERVAHKTASEPSEWVDLLLVLLPTILNCFQGGFSELQNVSKWDRIKLNLAVRSAARQEGRSLRRKEVVALADSILETAQSVDEPTFNAMMSEAEI